MSASLFIGPEKNIKKTFSWALGFHWDYLSKALYLKMLFLIAWLHDYILCHSPLQFHLWNYIKFLTSQIIFSHLGYRNWNIYRPLNSQKFNECSCPGFLCMVFHAEHAIDWHTEAVEVFAERNFCKEGFIS